MKQFPGALVVLAVIIFLAVAFGSKVVRTIPPGHVGVAAIFGKVKDKPYPEGFHFVNPFYKWQLFDVRQDTHKEKAQVPSQDQLQTSLEVSVQYRLIAEDVPAIYRNTGDKQQVLNVHIIPKLRSVLREQGKTIRRAEDFFLEETQEKLQTGLELALREYLAPKGVEVQAALIRDIQLPAFIGKAIELKKEREQSVERQKAELERFKTEQQQKVAAAKAEREAAEQEAEMRRVLADAQAYEIQKITEAVADNPVYVQLQALEALKAISDDPSSKIYFINGDSPTPLPLMHIGEDNGLPKRQLIPAGTR